MNHLEDYILWRQDLDFQSVELGHIDALVLSLIAYIKFDEIEGLSENGKISLKEAANLYLELHEKDELDNELPMYREVVRFLKRIKNSKRFGEILMDYHVNENDFEEQMQFSATTFFGPGDSAFIAFRGTDDTILGWREDFAMGYLKEIPSQRRAVEYMDFVMGKEKYRKFYVGGHSKGGNLAMYGSLYAERKYTNRIKRVYNFDGPGFQQDIVEKVENKEILSKTLTFIPESSIIGKLFYHKEEYLVVKSKQKGIMQHDPFSWFLYGPDFLYTQKTDQKSQILNDALKNWISKMNTEQRELFVETIFSIFDVKKIRTTTEMYQKKWTILGELMESANELDKEAKRNISDALLMLVREAGAAVIQKKVIVKVPKKY